MSISVTFTYRYYTQVFGGRQEIVGRGLNQLTSVQKKNLTAGIIDKTLSPQQREEQFGGGTSDESDIESG